MPLHKQSRRPNITIHYWKSTIQIQQTVLWYIHRTSSFFSIHEKNIRPLIFSENVITYIDDFFIRSQTKEEIFKFLDKYHQILLQENMKAAPDKSHFFLTPVKLLGHINDVTTITPLESQIDANFFKLQPLSNKKKI